MKVEDLVVPTDKCPLDFLAEMGERIANAWIFVDTSVIRKLVYSDGATYEIGGNCKILSWKTSEEYPETQVIYQDFECTGWYYIIAIEADDIAFKELYEKKEPEYIFRLKMAE